MISTEAPATEATEPADGEAADETESNTEETEAVADETEGNTAETEKADSEIAGDITIAPDMDISGKTEEDVAANTQASLETQGTDGESEYETDAAAAAADIVLTSGISIPGYIGGTVSKTMEYDCGNGVANDGSKSYLTIVTDTDADAFAAYKKQLADRGYRNTMEKEITSDDSSSPNLFASYVDAGGKYKLYTYCTAPVKTYNRQKAPWCRIITTSGGILSIVQFYWFSSEQARGFFISPD